VTLTLLWWDDEQQIVGGLERSVARPVRPEILARVCRRCGTGT